MELTDPTTARRTVIVTGAHGLHARPAAVFVGTVTTYAATVWIAKADGEPVNARSILAVLTLDVRTGDAVVLTAEGDDAEAAVEALAAQLGPGPDAP